jgi:hypothetical protein
VRLPIIAQGAMAFNSLRSPSAFPYSVPQMLVTLISYPLILSVLPLLASGTYTESDRCRPLAHSYAYIGHEDCYAVWDGELMMVLKNCAPDRHPTFSASQLALRQIHILLLAPSASRARIDATESNTSDGTLGGEQ